MRQKQSTVNSTLNINQVDVFRLFVNNHNLKMILDFVKNSIVNIFNFMANFDSKEFKTLHFNEARGKIGIECKCVRKNIFKYKVIGIVNTKNVDVEYPCEVGQLYKARSYLFQHGITPCFNERHKERFFK